MRFSHYYAATFIIISVGWTLRRRLSVVTQLKAKAIIIVGFISMVLLLSYAVIVEEGMFGNEEEHVVTVQWKMHEFYWDSGYWNDFLQMRWIMYTIPIRTYMLKFSKDIHTTLRLEKGVF
jgi:hypothetical protein